RSSDLENYKEFTTDNGKFEMQRQEQNKEWFNNSIENLLKKEILKNPSLKAKMNEFEEQVLAGKLVPGKASRQLMDDLFSFLSSSKS
ncbi:MAG: hypothetical protein RIA63_05175, partial [Cyclobacteriaceae bacterium]